jgi:protein-L-isoaspartate(D-aspartate) O-methyltransferase
LNRNNKIKENLKAKKKQLLDSLIVNDLLKDKRLIKAFMDVPLEKFIPDNLIDVYRLYEDRASLFYLDEQNPKSYRTISAPHMITIMLQGLTLSDDDDLLILGAKSGYIAALAHKLAPKGEIIILEANSEIAKMTSDNLKRLNFDNNITIIVKNPLLGMPELGPWQKILVTGAIEQKKIYPLLNQLDQDDGVLFAPIGQERVQTYTQILRQNNKFYGKKQLDVRFSPLITQVELEELELITDIDEFENQENVHKDPNVLSPISNKITIKYTENILEEINPESEKMIYAVDKDERDFIISVLKDSVSLAKNLKISGDNDFIIETINTMEGSFENLKKSKKRFELRIKRLQNELNQIRSYSLMRKELEKKDPSSSAVSDQKFKIINNQINEINHFINILEGEISRIKASYNV